MDVRTKTAEYYCDCCIHLTLVTVQWQAFVTTVMNLRFVITGRNSFTIQVVVGNILTASATYHFTYIHTYIHKYMYLYVTHTTFQFNLQSKCSLRYFATSVWGMIVWLMLTAGLWPFRRVYFMCDGLGSLNLMSISLGIYQWCVIAVEDSVRVSLGLHEFQILLFRPRMCLM